MRFHSRVRGSIYLIVHLPKSLRFIGVYVGQSIEPYRRFKQHNLDLQRNTHRNRYMQLDYNKSNPNEWHVYVIFRGIPQQWVSPLEYWIIKFFVEFKEDLREFGIRGLKVYNILGNVDKSRKSD